MRMEGCARSATAVPPCLKSRQDHFKVLAVRKVLALYRSTRVPCASKTPSGASESTNSITPSTEFTSVEAPSSKGSACTSSFFTFLPATFG